MGQIPEFQRRRLASSVVGTPGVNRAGEILGSAVTGAASQVEDVAYKAAVQRREIKEAAAANKTSIDLDMLHDNITRDYRTKNAEFRGDPQDYVTGYRAALEEGTKNLLNSVPEGNIRNAVEKYGYAALKTRLNSESNYADVRQAGLFFADAEAGTKLLGQRAGEVARSGLTPQEKHTQLQAIFDRGTTTYNVASRGVTAENSAKLKKLIPETIATEYLDALVDSAPQEMGSALQAVGGFLTEEKKAKYRKDAIESFKQQKTMQDAEYLMSTLDQNQSAYDKYLAGTLQYSDIKEISDSRAADTLNKLRLKNNTTTEEDKYSNYNSLYAEYVEMVSDAGTANPKDDKIKKGFSLDKVIDLQNRIMVAVADEKLPSGMGGSLMAKLTSPLNKKVKKQRLEGWFSDFKEMSTPFQMAFSYIRNEGKKAKLPPRVQSEMLLKFDQELSKLGDNPEPSVINQAIKKSYDEVLHKNNPKFGTYKVGQIVNVNGVDYEVTGFFPDGEPDVKPVEKKK